MAKRNIYKTKDRVTRTPITDNVYTIQRVCPFCLNSTYYTDIETTYPSKLRGHRGRDRMVIAFTTTSGISAYHH